MKKMQEVKPKSRKPSKPRTPAQIATQFQPGKSGNPSGASKKLKERMEVKRKIKEILGATAFKRIRPQGLDGIEQWLTALIFSDTDTMKQLLEAGKGKIPMFVMAYASALRADIQNGTTKATDSILRFLYGDKQRTEVTGKDGERLIPAQPLSPEEAKQVLKTLEDQY